MAPSTMLARFDDLSTFITWFCYHDLNRPELAESTKDCIKGMRRNFNKKNKAKQSGRTLQSEVALRHLPEATTVVEQVAKLQQPVQDRMEWARRFRSSTPPHVTKEVFGEFMGLLYSSLYLFSPQGRISGIHLCLLLTCALLVMWCCCCFCPGIDDLKLSSAQELIGQGHTMSTKFKTSSTFGFQPVTMSNISLELFHTYVDMLRPMVSQGRCNDPKHSLWLNWKGDKDTSIGRKVQRFYIRTLGLDVTTTRIRSLMETVANDLHESGDITLGAKNALGGTGGHGDATIKGYYLMNNMQKNVHQGRQVFEVFSEY